MELISKICYGLSELLNFILQCTQGQIRKIYTPPLSLKMVRFIVIVNSHIHKVHV